MAYDHAVLVLYGSSPVWNSKMNFPTTNYTDTQSLSKTCRIIGEHVRARLARSTVAIAACKYVASLIEKKPAQETNKTGPEPARVASDAGVRPPAPGPLPKLFESSPTARLHQTPGSYPGVQSVKQDLAHRDSADSQQTTSKESAGRSYNMDTLHTQTLSKHGAFPAFAQQTKPLSKPTAASGRQQVQPVQQASPPSSQSSGHPLVHSYVPASAMATAAPVNLWQDAVYVLVPQRGEGMMQTSGGLQLLQPQMLPPVNFVHGGVVQPVAQAPTYFTTAPPMSNVFTLVSPQQLVVPTMASQ